MVPALGSQGDALPLLEVTTTGKTPQASEKVSAAVISALRKYLTTNGKRSDVPDDQQVNLVVLNPPKAGELISGRSPTMFLMVWLLGAVRTLGLVYVLENLYPRKPVRRAAGRTRRTSSRPRPTASAGGRARARRALGGDQARAECGTQQLTRAMSARVDTLRPARAGGGPPSPPALGGPGLPDRADGPLDPAGPLLQSAAACR